MRLIVARCQVAYAGRLSTVLPEAVRLLMVGPDGTFMVWADGGGVKPLNWMTPPNVLEEQRDRGRRAAPASSCAGCKGEDRLEIAHRRGALRRPSTRWTRELGLEKEGVERELQELLADAPELVRRGAAARAPRVAHRHRPRRPDVPRRRGRVDRGRDQAHRHDRRGRAADALPRAHPLRTPRWARCRGVLAAQTIKPQAVVLAESRGIDCVEVDIAVLRGEREPDLTLFAA